MSTESNEATLRRAAETVRDRGLFASPGPWTASNPRGARHWQVAQVGHEALAQIPPHDNVREPANAEWIALANPSLAEPLADLLEAIADGSDDVERLAFEVARSLTGN